jgi:hypothetical protein
VWPSWSKETPPRGGFLFTMFPHQEPCVRGPPSKDLYQVLRGWSSYTTHGSWWGNIVFVCLVNRKPPPGGVFFSIKADLCLSPSTPLLKFEHESWSWYVARTFCSDPYGSPRWSEFLTDRVFLNLSHLNRCHFACIRVWKSKTGMSWPSENQRTTHTRPQGSEQNVSAKTSI